MKPSLPTDVHTHHLRPQALVNLQATDADSEITAQTHPDHTFSAGIHPWQAAEVGETDWERLRRLLALPNVIAVGECGLDRLCDRDLTVQLAVFERQIGLATAYRLPLLIHNVRAQGEILQLHRLHRPSVPWVIHGFRGKAETARQLWQRGICTSFGERFNSEALAQCPPDLYLSETDESALSIAEIRAMHKKFRP